MLSRSQLCRSGSVTNKTWTRPRCKRDHPNDLPAGEPGIMEGTLTANQLLLTRGSEQRMHLRNACLQAATVTATFQQKKPRILILSPNRAFLRHPSLRAERQRLPPGPERLHRGRRHFRLHRHRSRGYDPATRYW